MSERRARVYRETLETKVAIELDLNGDGSTRLESPLPFLNHMLSQLSKHGRIGIVLEASGDTDVDPHHLMEDVGIVLGEAFGEALGDKRGSGALAGLWSRWMTRLPPLPSMSAEGPILSITSRFATPALDRWRPICLKSS